LTASQPFIYAPEPPFGAADVQRGMILNLAQSWRFWRVTTSFGMYSAR